MADEPTNVDQLLRLFAEQTREHAIMLLDTQGRIMWWSSGAEHIFGMSSKEALGEPSARLFTPEEIERGLAEHEITVAQLDGAAEDDRWLKRADGSLFWAAGVMVALRDAQGELVGFCKILRNRTELKEQLEMLRNQLAASDAAVRRKDVFLSTLSHELRNPLAPLCNAVQLIRMTVPATPELEYPLKVIERQVESLRRLMDDLLDLSRINAGKIELRRETVALHEIVHRAVESAGASMRERRHQLEVLMPSAPILVQADPARLGQVFVNLINNAVKYTPEEGRIWIKGTTEGEEAVVRVADTGVGIPPEVLPRIFELFTQVEESRSLSQGGLGIGLSVVKNLVTLHGGSVQVRSDGPGKGSEFTVRLPLSPHEGGRAIP